MTTEGGSQSENILKIIEKGGFKMKENKLKSLKVHGCVFDGVCVMLRGRVGKILKHSDI